LANILGAAEISPEQLRSSLQSEIDRQASIWINLAYVAVLGLFGRDQEMRVAMDQYSILFNPIFRIALFQVLTISSDGLMPEIFIRPLLLGQNLLWKVGVSPCGLDLVTNPEQTVNSWLITNGSNVKPIGAGLPCVTKSERRSANDGASE
jgi:hypothetical protein